MDYGDAISILSSEDSGYLTLLPVDPTQAFSALSARLAASSLEIPALAVSLILYL